MNRHSKATALLRKFNRFRQEPFFAVIHFAEAHYPYYSQSNHRLYRRCCQAVTRANWNLGEKISRADMDLIKFCYGESIKYLDGLVSKQIKEDWTDTEYYIIGDHGLDLWENKMFGNGYTLSQECLRVPLKVVGGAKEKVARPTSLRELFYKLQGKDRRLKVKAQLLNRYTTRDWDQDVPHVGDISVEVARQLPKRQEWCHA